MMVRLDLTGALTPQYVRKSFKLNQTGTPSAAIEGFVHDKN